jgi:uncharacterized membrane protein
MKIKKVAGQYLAGLSRAGKSWPEKIKKWKNIWPAGYREVNELLPIVLLVIVLPLIIVIAPSNVLRVILGLPLVLFLPGYTLLAALYVRKDRLKDLDRLALSFAGSVAIVPLIGLVLNYMPSGISLTFFFLLIALFILVTSAIAWIRRGNLLEEERFSIRWHWRRPSLGGNILDRVLKTMLGLAAVAVAVSLVYVIVIPKTQENYTEFSISGLEDRSVYPTRLIAREEQRVVVTVVNRERRTLHYRIEVSINRVKKGQAGPLTLENGQKYEAEIGFTPGAIGARQEVEFALYIDGQTEPYLEPLRLWVDVQ